jgi:two-component system nitrate/nitrite response regulator NarL
VTERRLVKTMHEETPEGIAPRGAPPPGSRVRVAIADDHLLFAESLEIALTMEHYSVRRVPFGDPASSLASTAAAIKRIRPHIALLDLDLGRTGDGAALIRPLTEAGVAVVVVTGSSDRGRWGECIESGAVTVLTKTVSLDEMLATVRRVAYGVPVLTDGQRQELVRLWRARQQEDVQYRVRLDRLTARERDVLGHLTLGRTVGDIAALEVLSQATVRTQVKSILAKLEVSSQIAAVGIAHHVGWRSPIS